MTEAVTGTVRVDIKTLDFIDKVNYNDDISALFTTAHPVIDPDGSMYNLFSNVTFHLQIICMAEKSCCVILVTIVLLYNAKKIHMNCLPLYCLLKYYSPR